MGVWEQLVAETKRSSRDHSALAEICASHIVQRCTNINDDLQRMYKKVNKHLLLPSSIYSSIPLPQSFFFLFFFLFISSSLSYSLSPSFSLSTQSLSLLFSFLPKLCIKVRNQMYSVCLSHLILPLSLSLFLKYLQRTLLLPLKKVQNLIKKDLFQNVVLYFRD